MPRDKDAPWLPAESDEYEQDMSPEEFVDSYKKYSRNRNIIRSRDGMYRGSHGSVESVVNPPFVQGRTWRRLQKKC